MVSWWGIYSFFSNELIQISDVLLMNAECGSSGSFLLIVGSKCIGHNTYIGIRINLC